MFKKEYEVPQADITLFDISEIMSDEDSTIEDGGDYE